jgi:hypothetical protein
MELWSSLLNHHLHQSDHEGSSSFTIFDRSSSFRIFIRKRPSPDRVINSNILRAVIHNYEQLSVGLSMHIYGSTKIWRGVPCVCPLHKVLRRTLVLPNVLLSRLLVFIRVMVKLRSSLLTMQMVSCR